MNMITHNGIHYVPATELAKANDEISRYIDENAKLRSRAHKLETAAYQLIGEIKNNMLGSIVDTEA